METVAEKAPTVIRDKCGTDAGYSSHRHYKETPCDFCRSAHAIYTVQWRKSHPKDVAEKEPRVLGEKCGTTSGYSIHRYYKEVTCNPCRDANAAYMAQRKKDNPDAFAERFAKYYAENSKKLNAMAKRWRTDNFGVYKAQQSRYRDKHPEKKREGQRRRRARKKGNGFEPYTEDQVLERWGTDCHICHEPIDMNAPRTTNRKDWERGLHMDHVIALANGGRDDLENVKPAHGLCNLIKNDAS